MIVTNLQPPFETGGFFVRPEVRPSAQARFGEGDLAEAKRKRVEGV